MRILYITHWLPNNEKPTSGVFNRERLTVLLKNSNQVEVFKIHTLSPPINYFFPIIKIRKLLLFFYKRIKIVYNMNTVDIKIKTIFTFHLPKLNRISILIEYFSLRQKFNKVVNFFKPELIILTNIFPTYFVLTKLCKTLSIPIILITEGSDLLIEKKKWNNKKLENSVNSLQSKVVCVSKEMYKEVKKNFNFKNLTFIENGYDNKLFRLKKIQEVELPIKFISIGRLTHIKGYHIILRVLSKVKFDFTYTIIGAGNNNYRKKILSLINQYNLENKIILIGEKEHELLPDFLFKSDIFLMPSLSESFGISAVEAMACGLPVIGSNVGGLKKIIEENITGLKFNINDNQDIIDKLNEAIDFKWDRLQIANIAKSKYSWEKWYNSIESLWSKND